MQCISPVGIMSLPSGQSHPFALLVTLYFVVACIKLFFCLVILKVFTGTE